MNVLGISCYFHDAAAALIQGGAIIAAAEEERFTRKKHDYDFPRNAIRFCLEKGKIRGGDLDYVVFFEKPFVFERILMTCMQMFPRSWKVFREAMATWLGDKLWIKNTLRKEIGIDGKRIIFSEHHLSHAASAFLCSPFEEAAILTVDGVGEWTTASFGVGRGNNIRLLNEIRFPHSLGLLYSAFTAFLGFEVNEGEYKVMGMAPYGQPRYRDLVEKLIRVYDDGSFRLDMDYFSYHYSTEKTYNAKFAQLFGRPRDPKAPFFTSSTSFPIYYGEKPANYNGLAQENQRYADVAASIQAITEETLLRMANALYRETRLKKLCMAGGGRIEQRGEWPNSPGDAFRGALHPAIGRGWGRRARYAYHTVLGKPRTFTMDHAYWGKDYSAGEIQGFLGESGISHERVEDAEKLIDRVVESLMEGKVVGWFQGPFEWGPRALGNRSILADPRRADMKDIVNVKIKFREPYRPFALSVLLERSEEFFDLKDPGRHHPARFMLLVTPVREDKQGVVPATTHVDGSARLQTVHRETNPLYYRLIQRFEQATGVPVVLNTSFNLKGEPIVNTPAEGHSTFSRSGLDLLVLGHCVVRKDI